jgi:hypothetical protein
MLLIKMLVFYRVKVKVNFTLEQAIKAQRWSTNKALLFLFYLCVGWWRMVKPMSRPLYLRVSDPVFVVQEAGWAPGPVPLPSGIGCILSAGLV